MDVLQGPVLDLSLLESSLNSQEFSMFHLTAVKPTVDIQTYGRSSSTPQEHQRSHPQQQAKQQARQQSLQVNAGQGYVSRC